MAIRRDKILVVDIEATCWEETPPPGQVSEIIEVGLCLYHVDKGCISGKRSILVEPITSEISPFCRALTALTPQRIAEAGVDFTGACRILVEEYDARQLLWASWGGFDQKIFRRQCQRLGVSYPFGKKHLNLRRAYADSKGGSRAGLARALDVEGIGSCGTPHRGSDDAWNCARLLRHLLKKDGLDCIKRY